MPCGWRVSRYKTRTPKLELELEGELDRTGTADLVERVEAAIGATRAKAAG